MNRYDGIKNAYRSLGKEATFYDGMINLCHPSWKSGVWAGVEHEQGEK